MKNKGMKIIASFAILALVAFSSNVNAQFTKVGGGITFGTDEYPDLGLTAKGIFEINETIHLSPSFSFFFPEDFFGGKLSGWELCVDGHYVFADSNFQAYGIGGLALAGGKAEITGFGSTSTTDIGLNLGAGAMMDLSSLTGFAELKYQIGGFEALFLSAGVLFSL